MKTIICKFKSNGEDKTKTAILTDDLSTLSKSKKNEATDIIDDFIAEDEVWIIYFEENEHLGYEIQLKVNKNEKQEKMKNKMKQMKLNYISNEYHNHVEGRRRKEGEEGKEAREGRKKGNF